MGRNDTLLGLGKVAEFLEVDCTLQDWGDNLMVDLLGHLDWVLLVAVDLQLEDADAAGAAVLLDRVNSHVQFEDLVVFVAELGLQSGVITLGGSQERLQIHKTVGLLIEAPISRSELLVIDRELPAELS